MNTKNPEGSVLGTPVTKLKEVYVSIDGGGSKTEAVAFLANGEVRAHVLLDLPLNPNGSDVETSQVLARIYAGLSAQTSLSELEAVFVGLAGGSNAEINAHFQAQTAQAFGAQARVQVMHDAVAALWSGIHQLPGLVLIAGTGTVSYGIDAQGQEFRVGGWGYLIGDHGGGYDLGQRALQAITAAHDGVGPATVLTDRICAACAVDCVRDLIPLVYRDGKKQIAALAPWVIAAASEQDAVALQIISEVTSSAAKLLAQSVKKAEQSFDIRLPVDVVLAGGLWEAAIFRHNFEMRLSDCGLSAAINLIRPSLPPVFGGARYLLRMQGHATEASFDAKFTQGFNRFISSKSFDSEREASTSREAFEADASKATRCEDFGALATEGGDPAMRDLDMLDSLAIVRLIAETNQEAVSAVSAVAESIAAAVEGIFASLSAGGRLFYVGAGTSGRLGVLDASECPPTFGVSHEKVQGVIAGGESALIYPAEGAEDDASQAGKDLRDRALTQHDVVVAIAASGRTPYCIGALQAARALGARTVSIACNRDAPLSQWAEYPIEVATGCEMIAGSTRMKAGTAQKIVLNMLSTTVMIRMGKVYAGHMVDMQATNEKLKVRARRIVYQAGALSSEHEAGVLLERAQGEIKAAIVMAHTGLDFATAKHKLEQHQGYVRAAIGSS